MNGPLAVLIAYILGAIPFGYLVVKFSTGKDVRASGSGNIGATNVLRTSGKAKGVATLVLDIAKGFGAVWIASILTNDSPLWTSLAALAVMAGHSYPVFLRFKGGKAVAGFVGAFAYLTPAPLLAVMVLFLLIVAGTHLYLGWIGGCRGNVSVRRVADPAPADGGAGGIGDRGSLHRLSAQGEPGTDSPGDGERFPLVSSSW